MSPSRPTPPRTRRPTMTDVAKAAGVSQSTVSMVLNNATGARLSAETRARVLQEAMALGYRLPHRDPALRAKPGERAGQQAVIGYLVDEISTSPHPVVSLDGARDAAWEQGCVVQLAVTRNNPDQEAASIRALLGQPGLVGVVYSTIFTRKVEVPEALLDHPLVLLNCHDERRRLPAVVPSEVAGGHAATEQLITHGHTRIGFINGEPWMEAAQDRLKGYRRALATADLPFDPQLVREGDWMSGSGYEHTLALMALPRPPTAIFCANDLMALGALEALKHLGLAVPAEVSVMGYDDQEISRHTHPPLSTLVLPNEEMGRTAVELLMSLVAGDRVPRAMTKISGPVVLRESVAAAPARPLEPRAR